MFSSSFRNKYLSGALSFLLLMAAIFFISAVSGGYAFAEGDSGALVPCGNSDSVTAGNECGFNQFIELVQRVMDFLLFVIAVPLAAISFAYAGWLYMTSGVTDKVRQAHEIFVDVALGLCFALAAYLIVNAIIKGLGVASKYNFLGS